MKSHHSPLAWLAGLALIAGGCTDPSHLVFQQKTVLGVDAATDTTTGRVHVAIGYDRETNSFVPKTKVHNDTSGQDEHEAMSTISLSDIKVKILGTHEVNEQFATGMAAQYLADKPDALGQLTTLSEPAPTPAATPAQPASTPAPTPPHHP